MSDKKINAEDFSFASFDQNIPSSTTSFSRIKQNKGALIALIVLVIMICLAFAAPIISPRDPNQQNPDNSNLPPRIAGVNIPGFRGKMKNAKWQGS